MGSKMHQAFVAIIEQINQFRLWITAVGLVILGLAVIGTAVRELLFGGAKLQWIGIVMVAAGSLLGIYLYIG